MVRKLLIASTAIAAALVAVPAAAQDGGRHGGWRNRDGAMGVQPAPDRSDQAEAAQQARAQRAESRAQWQQQRAEAQQQAAPQQRSAPEGGWRSQRAEGGERYGRNWGNDGAVSRPAPAWRGATPAAPAGGVEAQAQASQRWGDRNRTYSDPNRSRTYRGGEARTGDWAGRNGAQTYREGYRDGRTGDNWRERTQQQQAYRNGYRSGSNDGYRSGSRDSYQRWNHNDWRRDSRYNWRDYRTHNRSLFSIGRYYSPYRSYSYSRLSIGFFLDSGFYGNRYWVNDPWQYRLPAAYGPYRWVRYYDDVLLVDIYSGEVVDVIYDFFW